MCTISTITASKEIINTYLDIVHQNFAESSRQHVLGLLVATVTDVGHEILALEPPAHPVVNTFRFSPVALQSYTHLSNFRCTFHSNCKVEFCTNTKSNKRTFSLA